MILQSVSMQKLFLEIPCYINLTINGLRNNVGLHNITITATDNGNPSLSTVKWLYSEIIPHLGDFLIVTNHYPPVSVLWM